MWKPSISWGPWGPCNYGELKRHLYRSRSEQPSRSEQTVHSDRFSVTFWHFTFVDHLFLIVFLYVPIIFDHIAYPELLILIHHNMIVLHHNMIVIHHIITHNYRNREIAGELSPSSPGTRSGCVWAPRSSEPPRPWGSANSSAPGVWRDGEGGLNFHVEASISIGDMMVYLYSLDTYIYITYIMVIPC